VRYDEFLTRYQQAHHDWSFGRMNAAEAADLIAALRAELPALEPAEWRRDAEDILRLFTAEISPEARERMARAVSALSAAGADDGTIAERIARAEAAITAITAIADESPYRSERHAILSLNETLFTLIEALRLDRSAGER
jgi:hypothetical protein